MSILKVACIGNSDTARHGAPVPEEKIGAPEIQR
jgi:hypothetical protein